LDIIGNLLSISLYEGLAYGLMALGVYITFRVLSFPDLSVDGSFPLGGAVAAVFIINDVSPWLATVAAFSAGCISGLGTALLNTKLRINALLSGILMMVALYSINLLIMGRSNIPLLREVTVFDHVADFLGTDTSLALSISFMVVLAIIILAVLNWFLRTEIGLAIRATGDNEQMVRGLGGNTDMTTMLGVSMSNGFVALSGSLIAQNQGFTDVGMGIGMIVMGLASVIIGEGLFRPKGVTSVLLAVFGGAFVYRLFISIALRLGLPPTNLKLVTALLVVAALSITLIRKKLRHEWVPPAVRM
jgi:putative ABC transport system permease protein|tara:strand:+ start:131 stop:1039 length:909 start_codon:yes stop_codon:yes gene_type:complete